MTRVSPLISRLNPNIELAAKSLAINLGLLCPYGSRPCEDVSTASTFDISDVIQNSSNDNGSSIHCHTLTKSIIYITITGC